MRWLALGGFLLIVAVPALTVDAAPDKEAPKPADWPTFRGPNRDDHSPDKGLLKEWPKEGPPLAWEKPAEGIGTGYSGVSVVGDKVYTMGDIDDSCYLFALDRATGKKLWDAKVGKSNKNGYAGPRCTPTVSGELVFALGRHGELVCVNTAGKEEWRKDFVKDFKGRHGHWDFSESVLVDGDKVVCTPGGEDATVVALNKKNGDVIWKGTVPPKGDTAGYSSIVIAEIGKVKQYVTLLANGVAGFNAENGKFLWRYGEGNDRFGGNTANIPTCIVVGKDQIFAVAGYGRGGALIKLTPNEDGSFKAEEVYFNRELNNKHGGVVMVGDHLYGGRDDGGPPYCADVQTGKVVDAWRKEKVNSRGRGSVAVTYADGKLYLRYQNNHIALVEPTPEGYKEISSFAIPKPSGAEAWPHPTVIGGKLWLRDQDKLWCYDVTAK